MNTPRPIVAGGTGASSASAALVNLGLTATAAELNTLDGITATTAELNILDGVTATASELNILDGATLTVTELNYVDGVTSPIQTQLDAKVAALADPGADRIRFWDDSAGAEAYLTPSTGLTITGTTITADTSLESALLTTTSGTSHILTDVPSWANAIDIGFDRVSTNANNDILIRLGPSSGLVTTGYDSYCVIHLVGQVGFSDGIGIAVSDNVRQMSGVMRLMRVTSNIWSAAFNMVANTSPTVSYGAGRVDVAGTLTQIGVVANAGSFDNGQVRARYYR